MTRPPVPVRDDLGPTCGMPQLVAAALPGLAAAGWIGLRWVALPWWVHRRHTRLPRRRR